MEQPIRAAIAGIHLRFYSEIIDESHVAWNRIKDDCYLFETRIKYNRLKIFDSLDLEGHRRLDKHFTRIYPNFKSITSSEASSTSEGISRFVANAFRRKRDTLKKIGVVNTSWICDHLQNFISENPPGTSKIAVVDIMVYHVYDFSSAYEVTYDDGSYLSEIIAYLFDVEDNSRLNFKMELVEYKIGMGDGSCSICLDDFVEKAEIEKTDCSHYFHKKCINAWLIRMTTCPVCRDEMYRPMSTSHNRATIKFFM